MPAAPKNQVLIALKRPSSYADVYPELVAVDALDPSPPWPHEIVRDDGVEVVIALERDEDCEGVPAAQMA